MIGAVADEKARRGASRYETVIATLVGFLALCISGYTAYMERQQVRATVWPILEFDSSNAPQIQFTLSNKGVGPAIIKHVIVRLDGQPVRNWSEALEKLMGPGEHHASESDMSNRVLSPGESITVLAPHGPDDSPLTFDRANPLWIKMNKERWRVTVEICYASTLGECWSLRAGGNTPGNRSEVGSCPKPSAITFQQ